MLLEDVRQLFNQFWFDLDTRSSSSVICLCQTLDQRLWLMAAIYRRSVMSLLSTADYRHASNKC